jgi:hypothetical protein
MSGPTGTVVERYVHRLDFNSLNRAGGLAINERMHKPVERTGVRYVHPV